MQPEFHIQPKPAEPLGIGDRVKTNGPRRRKCDRGLVGLVVKVSNGSVHVCFDDGSAGEFDHDHDGLISCYAEDLSASETGSERKALVGGSAPVVHWE